MDLSFQVPCNTALYSIRLYFNHQSYPQLGAVFALAPELTLNRTGKQTLGGHKQNLVCSRTQENGAVIPQEIDQDLPMSVQESPAEAGVSSVLLQGPGH